MRHIIVITGVILLISGRLGAFQIEGGVNYNLHKWSPVFSMDIYPWTFSENNKSKEKEWNGLALHFNYTEEEYFMSLMFGKAEIWGSKTSTIFIGPEMGINNYHKAGVCLKGTTFFQHFIPFSLVVDPKYDFKNKEMVWDFKCTVGFGTHRPLDQAFKSK